MQLYKIESEVPMPRRGAVTATARKLKVGESFYVPNEDVTIRNLRGTICRVGKTEGKLFSVSYDKAGPGARVWRIK